MSSRVRKACQAGLVVAALLLSACGSTLQQLPAGFSCDRFIDDLNTRGMEAAKQMRLQSPEPAWETDQGLRCAQRVVRQTGSVGQALLDGWLSQAASILWHRSPSLICESAGVLERTWQRVQAAPDDQSLASLYATVIGNRHTCLPAVLGDLVVRFGDPAFRPAVQRALVQVDPTDELRKALLESPSLSVCLKVEAATTLLEAGGLWRAQVVQTMQGGLAQCDDAASRKAFANAAAQMLDPILDAGVAADRPSLDAVGESLGDRMELLGFVALLTQWGWTPDPDIGAFVAATHGQWDRPDLIPHHVLVAMRVYWPLRLDEIRRVDAHLLRHLNETIEFVGKPWSSPPPVDGRVAELIVALAGDGSAEVRELAMEAYQKERITRVTPVLLAALIRGQGAEAVALVEWALSTRGIDQRLLQLLDLINTDGAPATRTATRNALMTYVAAGQSPEQLGAIIEMLPRQYPSVVATAAEDLIDIWIDGGSDFPGPAFGALCTANAPRCDRRLEALLADHWYQLEALRSWVAPLEDVGLSDRAHRIARRALTLSEAREARGRRLDWDGGLGRPGWLDALAWEAMALSSWDATDHTRFCRTAPQPKPSWCTSDDPHADDDAALTAPQDAPPDHPLPAMQP